MNILPFTNIAQSISAGTSPLPDLISLSRQILLGLENEGFCYSEHAYTASNLVGAWKTVTLGWCFSDGTVSGRFTLAVLMTAMSAQEWTLILTVLRATQGAETQGERLARSTLVCHPGPELAEDSHITYSSHNGRSDNTVYATDDYSAGAVVEPDDGFQMFLRRFEANVTAELAC